LERTSITDMPDALAQRPGTPRLSSNPKYCGIIQLLGNGLCRHLHIPLQSGDDKILSSMRRNYTSGFYRDLLVRIADAVPSVALGADIMVGYPGEGEAEFKNTMDLVESVPLTHLHVFSYSPRPGTAAASMPDQVPEIVKKERSEAVRRLGKVKNFAFREGIAVLSFPSWLKTNLIQTGLLSGSPTTTSGYSFGASNSAYWAEISIITDVERLNLQLFITHCIYS
jgi:threonylcarbamoyladenosine tRNA methylthiotransferase MtaB